MATYEDLVKANATIVTTDIKGRQYAEVNQRIKAFRMCYPDGYIKTHFFSLENGVCVMLAEVGYYAEDGSAICLGQGTAYEKESSSFINKTSYIENCETSAVGRALGMAGFGIDTSVASFEEVSHAIAQQESRAEEGKQKIMAQEQADKPISSMELKKLEKLIKDKEGTDPFDVRVRKICSSYGVADLGQLKKSQYVHLCGKLTK